MDMPDPKIIITQARDGTDLAFALYLPRGDGPFPTLFAASPYRFDNNSLPHGPQFLWRETGPIAFYLECGYAFVHMDARGCGRSGGHFELLGPNEQTDLYDAIAFVAQQGWCNGRIGSIGQSYYCMLQWFMAIQAPPGLTCIGAHDGLNDPYRAAAYHGGIPCDFFASYWWNQNRAINANPAVGPSRVQEPDLNLLLAQHPTLDEFWRERSASERLTEIKLPLYSSGVWTKMQLHTRGNIDGFRQAQGPKKLRMSGVPNAFAAADEFNSVAFHEKVMMPFYDHYLKDLRTDYLKRPAIEYSVRGSNVMRSADVWPPAGTRFARWYLAAGPSGSVSSLNDGRLVQEPDSSSAGTTSYDYPQPGWVNGTIGFGPNGPAGGFDPARRMLTFTSKPLAKDMEICGPIKLELFASSSRIDTDFFIKVMDQAPQAAEARATGLNPSAEVVSRGWLRASHRALDLARSTEMEPVHTFNNPQPLVPNEITRFDISIEPMAYLFKAGHCIRIDLVNGDSAVTEALWTHFYMPSKIGCDTIHHTPMQPSCLILPVQG